MSDKSESTTPANTELTQAETNEALASAQGSVTAGGTVYLVDKLTTASVFALYEWASNEARKLYNPFREVVEALDGLNVDAADKTRLLQQAGMVKAAGDVPGGQITKCLRSVEGVAFYLWITARGNHPGLTFEACRAMVTEENRLDLYCQLDAATGANIVNKAVIAAGFFLPDSTQENHGSSPTAAAPSESTSIET